MITHCPSVHNFFKQYLLLNHELTLTKVHMIDPCVILTENLFKDLESMQNSVSHGNQKKKKEKSSSQKPLDRFQYN